LALAALPESARSQVSPPSAQQFLDALLARALEPWQLESKALREAALVW